MRGLERATAMTSLFLAFALLIPPQAPSTDIEREARALEAMINLVPR